MKKLSKKLSSLFLFLILATTALTISNSFAAPVQAQTATTIDKALSQVGQPSQLPGFDTAGHADSSYEPGADSITSAILYVVDLFTYLIGTIAVLVMISSGVRLITATKNIDDISEKQKESIKYAAFGLIVIVLANTMVKQVFFGEQGEVFRSEADIQMAAERGTEQLMGVVNFLEIFIGALAILMIIIAGFRRVISAGKEETITKSNKAIMWAIMGLILVALSEFIIKGIVFPDQGSRLPDIGAANQQIISLTNFVSGFIATIAVGMYMYGGYLYVLAGTNEENATKAKKVFVAATIGLIVAMGAFALVNTFIKVEPLPVQEAVTTDPSPLSL